MAAEGSRGTAADSPYGLGPVRLCDPAGRSLGAGFVADELGTVLTGYEAVAGADRIVLHAPGERTCVVAASDVVPLPHLGLALVRSHGLDVRPLPVTVRDTVPTGAYVRIAARGWRQARVLGTGTRVTYDGSPLLPAALELAVGTAGSDALRPGGGAAGGPVLDPDTGAVIGVLGTALRPRAPGSGPGAADSAVELRAAGFAVPLRQAAAADPEGPLAALLARNAATVPAYGADLNVAGVLLLTATSVGSDGPRAEERVVERPDVAAELGRFLAERGETAPTVLGLVGAPGSGRTTELAALARRRARGPEPAPTVWLRGADLQGGDTSVADAVGRALAGAGRIVVASAGVEGLGGARAADPPGGRAPGESSEPSADPLGDISPERVARLVRAAGRPLAVLLDRPEEMPPALAHRLAEWTEGSAAWLRATGTRLVVACRDAYWEQAGPLFPGTPACVRLGPLDAALAARARARYGIPDDAVAPRDAGHPLTLRMLADVRAALPGAPQGTPARDEILDAHLDLMCLRIAVRVAAAQDVRGTAVRRLAAYVAGRVHEAARRCLGPGQGELDRASFEEVFPWSTGLASALLTEGLIEPAGNGYRFAHEELADWLQGAHLDLDAALHALVHRWRTGTTVPVPGVDRPLPVPRHRIGPVAEALLHLGRQQGDAELAVRLAELADAAEDFAGRDATTYPQDAPWWAARLIADVLLRVPDARPYLGVLRLLGERIARHGAARPDPYGSEAFGPGFWRALPLPAADRLDLLRRLVVADPGPGAEDGGGRYLDAVGEWLKDAPHTVQPLLTRWFTDERPLHAAPDATVARAAQALLHTHRHRGIDDLTEALVSCAHPRAEELLGALAEEEPSALCRAVDRWAHDARRARRVAAAAYGLRTAPHARTGADLSLLRYAALALLARPADCTLHGAALALLVHDPQSRARHLPLALRRFAAGDPQLPARALAAALDTHPESVLDAFRARLREPGPVAGDVLRTLTDVATPALARRTAGLLREFLDARPDAAPAAAAHLDRRLDHGPPARAVLFPLVCGLLRSGSPRVRRAVAEVLARPGSPASRPLRAELLDVLLGQERDPAVLDVVAVAEEQPHL